MTAARLRWMLALLLALQGPAFAQEMAAAALPAASSASFAQLPQMPDLPALPDLHPLTQPLLSPESGAAPEVGRGLASWYGPRFHGRRTASGERFDRYEFTAAHRTLPFGARVCVRSALTGKAVVVRINDRGPFGPGRVIDLSQAAAEELGMVGLGIKPVELWHLGPDEDTCPASLQDAEVVAPGVDEAAPSPQRKARAKARPRPKPRRR